MDDIITALENRFPDQVETVQAIWQIREWVRTRPLPPFREPKSLIVRKAGKIEIGPMSSDELNGWRRHVADGTFARLRQLEGTILSELVADRLTPAMVLARAHMEVGGLAAYSSEVLFAAGREGAWDRLAKLVQQVYFGSSMSIQAKGTAWLGDFVVEEVCPIRPSEFIKAMDRFACGGRPLTTRYQVIYGILSDFAHPVTTRSFYEVINEDAHGWSLRYKTENPIDSSSATMAFEALLGNMQIGYSCASLLAQASVDVTTDGEFVLRTPTEEQAGEIWLRLLDVTATGKPPAA